LPENRLLFEKKKSKACPYESGERFFLFKVCLTFDFVKAFTISLVGELLTMYGIHKFRYSANLALGVDTGKHARTLG